MINIPDTVIFEKSEAKFIVFTSGEGDQRLLQVAQGRDKISMTEIRQFFSSRTSKKRNALMYLLRAPCQVGPKMATEIEHIRLAPNDPYINEDYYERKLGGDIPDKLPSHRTSKNKVQKKRFPLRGRCNRIKLNGKKDVKVNFLDFSKLENFFILTFFEFFPR